MKTLLKANKIILSVLLISGCNGPSQDIKISSLKDKTYKITGAFKKQLTLPSNLNSKSVLFVQNGASKKSFSEINSNQAYCELDVESFTVSYPEVLQAYQITELPLSLADSALMPEGIATVLIKKQSNGVLLSISDVARSYKIKTKAPSTDYYLTLVARVNCSKPGSSLNALDLTVRELMDIFTFKYVWKAPSV